MANATVVRMSGAYTLETTIPKFAVEQFRIRAGDLIEWKIEIQGGQNVLVAKKAEKSGSGV